MEAEFNDVAIGFSRNYTGGAATRAKKAGKTMEGRPQRLDTVCGKHSDHKNAKWWKFENKALGKVLEGKNLNQLVRDNEDLFDQEDLKWDACGCTASRCLRTLKSPGKNRTRNSWKGWMICTPNAELTGARRASALDDGLCPLVENDK